MSQKLDHIIEYKELLKDVLTCFLNVRVISCWIQGKKPIITRESLPMYVYRTYMQYKGADACMKQGIYCDRLWAAVYIEYMQITYQFHS